MSSTSILSSQPSPTRAPTDHGNGNNGNNGNNGPTSSPLLFFVALGFGVVFTNLWIIVGVKYCFRYNRRRAAQNAANTEIDMANMPRPHRRRREKKLMTMDEVNQRFPLTKYKQWKSSRETEGLPSSGGIATAPQSRAPSIKHVEAASTAPGEGPGPQTDTALAMARRHASKNSTSGETMTPRSSVESAKGEQARDAEKQLDKDNAVTAKAKESHDHGDAPQANVREREDDSDDSDDDPIRTATAPELLADPGDTCAICIDLLEDDDDVRGLACGHAFHASCVDPWLTSRRACCPLCKADYYVPKPRPEGEVDTATGRRSVASPRSPPQAVWSSSNPFSRSRVLIISSDPHQAGPDHLGRLGRHSRRSHPTSRDAPQDTAQTGHNSNWLSRITPSQSRPPMFSHWFARNRGDANNVNTPPTATQQPTPGQLEAGTR